MQASTVADWSELSTTTTTTVMANVTAQPVAAVVQLTEVELYIQAVVFYGFICGVVSTVTGLLICAAMVREKSLQTRFFAIVTYLTGCRVAACAQFLAAGIYRTLRTANVVPLRQTRLVCHTANFNYYWVITLESCLLLYLVVDRCAAVGVTSNYRRWTVRTAVIGSRLLCLTILIVKLVPSYMWVDMGTTVDCINFNSPVSSRFSSYSTAFDLVIICLVILIYLGLLVMVRVRTRRNQDKEDQLALRRQLKLLPVLRNMVIIHVVFCLFSRIIVFWGTVASPNISQRLVAYGGTLGSLDMTFNIFYLLFNQDVRRALTGWFGAKNSRNTIDSHDKIDLHK